jgi:hypothetical protein
MNTTCAQRTDREWTKGIMVLQHAAVFDSLTCLNAYRSLQMTQPLVARAARHARENLAMPPDALCPRTLAQTEPQHCLTESQANNLD